MIVQLILVGNPVNAEEMNQIDKTEPINSVSIEDNEVISEPITILETEDIDTFIDESQIQTEDIIGGEGVSTLALEDSPFSENNTTVTLDGLTASGTDFSGTDFKSIISQGTLREKGGYANGDYFGIQGGCFDGTYYYYCFLVKNANKVHIDSLIIWGTVNTSGAFTYGGIKTGLKDHLQHVNDLTYNKDTKKIAIVCCEKGYHNTIYTISAADLRNGNLSLTK